MAVTAHAVAPPAVAAAPPVQRKADPVAETQEAPQRLLTSLSSVPAVQRKCGGCAGEENEDRMPVQPRLEVGPVDDHYEREADDIAGQVMAMREPAPASATGATVQRAPAEMPELMEDDTETPRMRAIAETTSAAGSVVQRSCAACSSKSDEVQRAPDELPDLTQDDEQQARMRAAAGKGGEHIAASSTQLTSGGSSLAGPTRDFFESRMGRDLSGVRVHRGSAADALNQSISARAFTFRNHIWLSRAEPEAQSETMAHELAHVLQQTQPGPLGEDAMARRLSATRSGDGTIRRNYWQELGAKHLTKKKGGKKWRYLEDTSIGRHTAIHEELQAAMIGANSSLVTEARIPGASGKGEPEIWKCGYADLYTSSNGNVPGLEVISPSAPSAPEKKKKAGKKYAYRNIERGGNCGVRFWVIHSTGPKADYTATNGFPKVDASNSIINCELAPTDIKLGDVKPGHNETARSKGVAQLDNYLKGLNETARRINSADGKVGCWTPNPSKMAKTDLTIPADWKATRRGGWDIDALEFRAGALSKSFRPYGLSVVPPGSKKRVRGRKSAAHDPKNTGIWVYFIEPNPTDLKNALKDPSTDKTRFPTLSKRLQKVFGCLKSTPATSAKACRRPIRAPADRVAGSFVAPLRTASTGSRLMRKIKKAPMKKHEDKFDLAAWNAMRIGSPAGKTSNFDKDNLSKTLSTKFTNQDEIESIEFRAAVAAGLEKNERLLGKANAYKLPPGAASKRKGGLIEQGKTLSRAQFWAGKFAGLFGTLRKKMGGAFGKTVEMWEKFSEKAKSAFGKTKLKNKNGSALAVAAKGAASHVLKIIGTSVLRKTAGLVMGCFKSGFTKYVEKLVEGTSIEELQIKAKKIGEEVVTLKDEVFGDLKARAEAAVGPLRDKLKEIAEMATLVTKLVGVASTIAHGLRVGTCLAGLSAAGVGAAVTCLASVGDFILSQFNASPIDYVVSKIIKSCHSKRLIAKAMLSFDKVANLPTTVARAIVTTLRGALPQGIQDVFCKPEEIEGEKVTERDFKCNDAVAGGWGNGYSSGTITGDSKGASSSGAKEPQSEDKKKDESSEAESNTPGADAPEAGSGDTATTSGQQTKFEVKIQTVRDIGPTPKEFKAMFIHGVESPFRTDSSRNFDEKTHGGCYSKIIKISILDTYGFHQDNRKVASKICRIERLEKARYPGMRSKVWFKTNEDVSMLVTDKNGKPLVSYAMKGGKQYMAWIAGRKPDEGRP